MIAGRNNKGQFVNIGCKYVIDLETNCWVWIGALDEGGYGRVFNNGKNRPAHRVIYESLKNKIPHGLDLDHLCRNRACVNPDHLEPVEEKINTRRGLKTKLTQAQVDEIKLIPRFYGYRKVIKDKYNIGDTQISRIINGEQWR